MLSEIHEPALKPFLRHLSGRPPVQGLTIQLPGGAIHTFNGKYQRIGTGLREAEFTPRRGRVNHVRNLPDLRHTPPSRAPMPARRSLRLGRVAPGGLGVGVAVEAINEWRRFNAQHEIAQEWEAAIEIITAAAEAVCTATQPDAELQRLPPAIGIATAQEEEEEKEPRQRRIVIHGYSRKPA